MAAQAVAQPPRCMPPDVFRELLGGQYGEVLLVTGALDNGGQVEIYVSPERSFTFAIRKKVPGTTKMQTCFMASGEGYAERRLRPYGPGT